MRKNGVFSAFFARRSAKSVRKQCFFTSFGTLCQSSQNKRFFLRDVMQKVWVFFHVFQDTLYKVRRKGEKSAFFELFLQLSRKQCSFTFFKTLCTNFAENKQNQRFLSFFCDVPEKVWGNSVFLRFSRHFKIKFEKMRKTSFFELFARCSAKSVRKQCFFSRFSKHFVRSSQKMLKNSVFWSFSASFREKCEKTVFFHVFRNTLYKVREKSLKTEFFLRDVMQRVWENNVLSPFSRHFVQSSQKMRKISVFCATLCKKCEKTVFFSRFLRHFVQIRIKCWKTVFFHFFLRRSAKSVRKQCFFTFFETLCTKFARNAKKKRFLSFLRDGPQKVWENSVFSPFFERHFVQSSQKKWKNSVSFARCYAKSMTKQCSFTFFKTLCTMFAENEKNQRILSFLLDVPQKVLENSVFSRFSSYFVHS